MAMMLMRTVSRNGWWVSRLGVTLANVSYINIVLYIRDDPLSLLFEPLFRAVAVILYAFVIRIHHMNQYWLFCYTKERNIMSWH